MALTKNWAKGRKANGGLGGRQFVARTKASLSIELTDAENQESKYRENTFESWRKRRVKTAPSQVKPA